MTPVELAHSVYHTFAADFRATHRTCNLLDPDYLSTSSCITCPAFQESGCLFNNTHPDYSKLKHDFFQTYPELLI